MLRSTIPKRMAIVARSTPNGTNWVHKMNTQRKAMEKKRQEHLQALQEKVKAIVSEEFEYLHAAWCVQQDDVENIDIPVDELPATEEHSVTNTTTELFVDKIDSF